jgi:hypothetical protein
VAARVASAAYTGREIAGVPGAAAGGVAAFAGAFASWRARKLVVELTGLPDPVVAVGEDLLAYTAAVLATRPEPAEPAEAHRTSWTRGAFVGVAAGLAGTAAMTIAQGAAVVLTRAEPSRAPLGVARRLKRRGGKGRRIKHKGAVNQGMHWLYGTSWGVPFGLVTAGTGVRPEVAGPAFGLVVWGAGLAHQPALGVAQVPWERSAGSLASEALFHVAYGVGAAGAVRALAF